MKRRISLILAFTLLITFPGCILYDPSEYTQESHAVKPQENVSKPNENESKTVQKEVLSIEETVLVDEKGIKVTAKSITEDGFWGPSIKLLIENNSGKNLTFQTRNSSVNGYMVDFSMSEEVADGKKANAELTISDSDFEACGIETIAFLEFSVYAYDSDNWDKYYESPQIIINTSASKDYKDEKKFDGVLAYEGKGIKIIALGVTEGGWLGPEMMLYIENNSGKSLTVQTRDVSVNGFMVDAIFSCDIFAGKKAVDGITFSSSDMEKNDITSMEEIELSFHIFDEDSWNTIVDTPPITIKVK